MSQLNNKSSNVLTGQEIYVFNLLQSKQGIAVSRQEIGQAIWGVEATQKYNDVVIDQVISRIRFKLERVAYPGKVKTVKGKGFLLKA